MRAIAMNRLDVSPPAQRRYIDTGTPIFVSPLATLAICLIVFGVLHTVAKATAARTAIDGMLAVNAAFYLVAALLAKLTLYAQSQRRSAHLARYANYFSIAGLVMTIAGTCWLELVVAFPS
jgi:hypothetical protein